MKLKLILPLFVALVVLCGCTAPQQRVAYNTLATTHAAVDGAFISYMATVLAGTTPTNDVPKLAQAYRTYQTSFNIALEIAQFNTNTITPPTVESNALNVLKITRRAQ